METMKNAVTMAHITMASSNTRNMVYKKHREIQYSYVSKIDLKIQ